MTDPSEPTTCHKCQVKLTSENSQPDPHHMARALNLSTLFFSDTQVCTGCAVTRICWSFRGVLVCVGALAMLMESLQGRWLSLVGVAAIVAVWWAISEVTLRAYKPKGPG